MRLGNAERMEPITNTETIPVSWEGREGGRVSGRVGEREGRVGWGRGEGRKGGKEGERKGEVKGRGGLVCLHEGHAGTGPCCPGSCRHGL